MAQRHLDPQLCFFINFEDPRLIGTLDHRLLDTIVAFAKGRSSEHVLQYFFFDEIQQVANWEKWLHTQVERPKNRCFIITGSNSSLLSGDLATAMTGRHFSIELFPFDYLEYLKACPDSDIDNYMRHGGFPRALAFPTPTKLLQEYFRDIIARDIQRHVSARNPQILTQLVKLVYETTASEASQRSLARTLGTTADTVGQYLSACEAAYAILPCPFFTFSQRQRLARNRKYYPIDLGLRNAVISRGGDDRGKRLETLVFHELRRRHQHVYYWKGRGEVDFIVQNETGLIPYQVSWDGPKSRHYQALAEFQQAYPRAAPPIMVSRDNVESFLAG